MVHAAALFAASVAVFWLAPRVLGWGNWRVRFPRLALTLWFAAFFGAVALAVAAVVVPLTCCLGLEESAAHGGESPVMMLGWLALALLGAVVGLVSGVAEPLARSRREAAGRFEPAVVCREERPGFTLVWVEADRPVTFAVPAREPEIVVATELRELLTSTELEAVIAHEHAHLRQRHSWAVRIAEVTSSCMPSSWRVGAEFRRATLLLVELIADDAAAKQVGAVHLANALAVMGRACGDMGMDLRADRLALRRWPKPRHRRVAAAAGA